MKDIETYKILFSNLHTKITRGEHSPNKSILLLSVINLIRRGHISSNRIYIDDDIKESFDSLWSSYVETPPPTVWTPFWHMKFEPFWHFQPIHTEKDVDDLTSPGQTASIGQMRSEISYAFFDKELYEILKTKEGRLELKNVLITSYTINKN